MSENNSDSQKERKMSLPESIAPTKEKEGITVKEIYSVIQSYFPNNQFDNF